LHRFFEEVLDGGEPDAFWKAWCLWGAFEPRLKDKKDCLDFFLNKGFSNLGLDKKGFGLYSAILKSVPSVVPLFLFGE
jgi:hypothetical protein